MSTPRLTPDAGLPVLYRDDFLKVQQVNQDLLTLGQSYAEVLQLLLDGRAPAELPLVELKEAVADVLKKAAGLDATSH